MDFKVGQNVICVNGGKQSSGLELKQYKVYTIWKMSSGYYPLVLPDDVEGSGWGPGKFVDASDFPEAYLRINRPEHDSGV